MSNEKWPCIFLEDFTKEQVNSRLAILKAPIGAFTRAWRWEHCATINPYGSESCPYAPEDCAIAYLRTAQDAMAAHTSKVGYFKVMARKRGIDRAENKPLQRDKVRTDGLESRASGVRSGAGTGSVDDLGVTVDREPGVRHQPDRLADERSVDLYSSTHRPQSIGSLLRPDGTGSRPRTRRWDEIEESTNNDGDTGDPVSPPPPGRLGDEPPS